MIPTIKRGDVDASQKSFEMTKSFHLAALSVVVDFTEASDTRALLKDETKRGTMTYVGGVICLKDRKIPKTSSVHCILLRKFR